MSAASAWPFAAAHLNGQFVRTLGKADFAMAEVGECLAVARAIAEAGADDAADGGFAAWRAGWTAMADRLRAMGEASREDGDRIGARDALMRASEYYRAAYFFDRSDLSAPDLLAAWRTHRDTYRAAVALCDHTVEIVAIPYEGTTLPGYLHRPADDGTPRPTLISPGGYDGTAEEFHFYTAAGAIERGWNALVFDGPGQGGALYEQGLLFRPDYEAVLTPVVDWLEAQPGVDPRRLVLMGRSFGGYLGPRAASGEQRFAALVADPGMIDLLTLAKKTLPEALHPLIGTDPARLDAVLAPMLADPVKADFFRSRMACHGIDSVAAYLALLADYSTDGRAGRIACPSLICATENDLSNGQAQALAAQIAGPTTLHSFTAAQGGNDHCVGMAQRLFHHVVFDWLGKVLPA